MRSEVYLTLAHIAGELWGTQARAHAARPQPDGSWKILGYDVYLEIFGKLKEDFRKEVTEDEAKAPDGEDD